MTGIEMAVISVHVKEHLDAYRSRNKRWTATGTPISIQKQDSSESEDPKLHVVYFVIHLLFYAFCIHEMTVIAHFLHTDV